MPVYMVPGNHDRRDNAQTAVFADWPTIAADPEFVQCVVDDFPVRLIGLDTVTPGSGGGRRCARRRLEFLGARAGCRHDEADGDFHASSRRSSPASAIWTRIGLGRGARALAELVRTSTAASSAFCCGHYHRPIDDTVRRHDRLHRARGRPSGRVRSRSPQHPGGFVFEPPAIPAASLRAGDKGSCRTPSTSSASRVHSRSCSDPAYPGEARAGCRRQRGNPIMRKVNESQF